MHKKIKIILLSIALIISTSIVFYLFSLLLDKFTGYLIGFLFYWIVWCYIIPKKIIKKPIKTLFVNKNKLLVRKNWWIILMLLSTLIAPIFIYTIPAFKNTSLFIIIVGIPLAIIHAIFEEIFWRGLYVHEFPNDIKWSIIIPSILFSLWHIAPQFSISDNNIVIFIISTIPLGLIYGIVAYKTGSAKWSAICHGVSGIFAYSGFLAMSLEEIIKKTG